MIIPDPFQPWDFSWAQECWPLHSPPPVTSDLVNHKNRREQCKKHGDGFQLWRYNEMQSSTGSRPASSGCLHNCFPCPWARVLDGFWVLVVTGKWPCCSVTPGTEKNERKPKGATWSCGSKAGDFESWAPGALYLYLYYPLSYKSLWCQA